jgi:hypothetical protein
MNKTGAMVENLRGSHDPAEDRDFVFIRQASATPAPTAPRANLHTSSVRFLVALVHFRGFGVFRQLAAPHNFR